MDRRAFLTGTLAVGCAPAAMPFLTQATFASVPGEARLVVAILRGGLDGLDLVRPLGDPSLARLRPRLADGAGAALGDFFALHPGAAGLMPLWQAGQMGFHHAVATPYRARRSHFDGQDLLESGTAPDAPPALRRTGWLNRLIQTLPGSQAQTAFGLGREALPILAGPAATSGWSPDTQLRLGAQGRALLASLYRDDPMFEEPAQTALTLSRSLAPEAPGTGPGTGPLAEVERFAAFAATRLRAETRIVALSMGGWDTHANQAQALTRPLARLEHLILRLQAELGGLWDRTAVLALTEFGRTAAENGSGGTDHGTGGVMLFAGGALRGGRVLGRWPGLASPLDGRDLEPTADVRASAAWVLRGLFGLDRATLEGVIFPGLDLGADPGLLHG
jgi:uncharacterized protein (DUF1501 family)